MQEQSSPSWKLGQHELPSEKHGKKAKKEKGEEEDEERNRTKLPPSTH